MTGSIDRWDVLVNSRTVIQGWGWWLYWRALFGGCDTFLSACCMLKEVTE